MAGGTEDSSVYTSLGATLVLLVAFYAFAAPFHDWTELRREWTPYVYCSLYLYWWLLSAIAFHASGNLSGLLDYDIKQPISLFFPIFGVTVVLLLVVELILVLARQVLTFFNNNSLQRISVMHSITTVIFNAGLVSVACCLVFLECDGELSQTKADVLTSKQMACSSIFDFTSKGIKLTGPSSWNVVLLVWCTGMVLVIATFLVEWLAWYSFFYEDQYSPQDYVDDNTKAPSVSEALPMVSWYSMVMFDVVFDLLISLKVFLGRFDRRIMQAAIHKDTPPIFEHLAHKEELWLDFMADCGDGFNSSYQVARMLAQPKLEVTYKARKDPTATRGSQGALEEKEDDEDLSTYESMVLPRGDCLVIGGDLAYHHPTADNYEPMVNAASNSLWWTSRQTRANVASLRRFWRVFEYAMIPPRNYNPEQIAIQKPHIPEGHASLSEYPGPTAFCIPGNHDWYDGLGTFLRFVCHRNWLGGWLLPQSSSYFALKLPNGWWLFGCDLALEDDLDLPQYKFFADIATSRMKPSDRVILVTHEPNWILDAYHRQTTGENLRHLINVVLTNRVALRLAGDIHNYQRHSPLQSDRDLFAWAGQEQKPPRAQSFVALNTQPDQVTRDGPSRETDARNRAEIIGDVFPSLISSASASSLALSPRYSSSFFSLTREQRYHQPPVPSKHPVLVVAGGGGAFLHPTHAPDMEGINVDGVTYKRKATFPSETVSRQYALLNIFGFRKRHWRIDFVSAITYFGLALSLLPQCKTRMYHDTNGTFLSRFISTVFEMERTLLLESYVSLGAMIMLSMHLVLFSDFRSTPTRLLSGICHCFCHVTAALGTAAALESIIDLGISGGGLGTQGLDSIWRLLTAKLPQEVPEDLSAYDLLGLGRTLIQLIHQLTVLYNVPEMHAEVRIKACKSGFDSLSRGEAITFYVTWFLYYFIMAAPVCAVVFGTYLYVSVNFFGVHYNEAFSSLKIENYKHIVRIHINSEGECEVFTLGVEKVPKKWIRDDQWSGSNRLRHLHGEIPSYQHHRPSRWQPRNSRLEDILRIDFDETAGEEEKRKRKDRYEVKVVDYFSV